MRRKWESESLNRMMIYNSVHWLFFPLHLLFLLPALTYSWWRPLSHISCNVGIKRYARNGMIEEDRLKMEKGKEMEQELIQWMMEDDEVHGSKRNDELEGKISSLITFIFIYIYFSASQLMEFVSIKTSPRKVWAYDGEHMKEARSIHITCRT